MELYQQGAEAKLFIGEFLGRPVMIKERFRKEYRHKNLDEKLTHKRTLQEVRSVVRCRKLGIRTPNIYYIDFKTHSIYMEYLCSTKTARDFINSELENRGTSDGLRTLAGSIGQIIAKLHANDLIHGDLTTSNILVEPDKSLSCPIIIDFGLSFVSTLPEDKGVDLYVLERAVNSTHPKADGFFEEIIRMYEKHLPQKMAQEVTKKLNEVRQRGRKRLMVG